MRDDRSGEGGSMLNVNDWIVINSITYDIHFIEDFDEMRLHLMQQLMKIIDFDAGDFFVVDKIGSQQLCSPVGLNEPEELMQEYIDSLIESDYSRGLMATGRNITYRDSDIIDEKARVATEFYQKTYAANNWHFSLCINLSFNDSFLGVLTLYRTKGKPDFEYRDIFILDMIKMHLALRLYNEISGWSNGKLSPGAFAKEHNLTNREEMILEYLIKGKNADEISVLIGISSNTVKKHIGNIYKKTNTKNRAQLISKIAV